MKTKIIFSQIILLIGLFANSQPATVYTCKAGSVDAYNYSEFSQQQISYYNNYTMSTYSYLGITFIDNSSAQYNCHSYAWHLREGNTNKVWINNATQQIGNCYDQTHNIDKYWTDGCFIQVCNESDADKVHYYCGDHSAVASTTNQGLWESKWGQLAVVRHARTSVPYADPTNSVNFYASTKITGDASNLCSGTRTFTVKNISGATYSWTYSNGISAIGSTSQNTFTVQRNGNMDGSNWVEVQLNTPCSNSSVIQRIDFTVGIPTIDFVSFSNPNGNPYGWCSNMYGNEFNIQCADPTASFYYEIRSWPNMNLVSSGQSGSTGTIGYLSQGFYVFRARPTNQCGAEIGMKPR